MTDTSFKHLHSFGDIEDAEIWTKINLDGMIKQTKKAKERYEALEKYCNERRSDLLLLNKRRQDICEHLVTSRSITYGYIFYTCTSCKKIITTEKRKKEESCTIPAM